MLLAFLAITPFLLPAQSLQLLGNLDYPVALSDVWGYETDGNEYALVGLFNGFSVVDISDPANPQEVYFTPGPSTAWRDVFTYQDRAYVISEGGDGLLIVDLSPLPSGSITTLNYYTGDNWPFLIGHNLFISNGVLYIFGSDYGAGGVIALDLTDPDHPTELGLWDQFYVHDGTIQGDTLWASLIDEGFQGVIDISDPTNMTLVSTWGTPGSFAHNSWISADNRFLYVTEELSNGFLTSYNVENISNPVELQKFRPRISNGAVPHNVHYRDEFLFLSHYRDGLMVIDANRPANLVVTGHYDTSSDLEGHGLNGCWGVYPDLPSGRILATDVEKGLFIFDYDNSRATYLEGTVRAEDTGNPIWPSKVKLIETEQTKDSDLSGQYSFGLTQTGNYSVEASAPGYVSKVESGLLLQSGEVTQKDIFLRPFTDGIDDDHYSGPGISLFPNPSPKGSLLDVTYTRVHGAITLTLYSLSGQFLFESQLNPGQDKTRIVSTLSPGSYWIEVGFSDGQKQLHQHLVY